MKKQVLLAASLLLCVLLANVEAGFSQEAMMIEPEATDTERERLEREKIMYSPGEASTKVWRADPTTPTPAPKDSSVTTGTQKTPPAQKSKVKEAATPARQPQQPAEKQEAKNQDDSILSFNFLYYIIEKYKLQDIVD